MMEKITCMTEPDKFKSQSLSYSQRILDLQYHDSNLSYYSNKTINNFY